MTCAIAEKNKVNCYRRVESSAKRFKQLGRLTTGATCRFQMTNHWFKFLRRCACELCIQLILENQTLKHIGMLRLRRKLTDISTLPKFFSANL